MTKNERNELIELLKEASHVLEEVQCSFTKENLPPSFRYPLADELYGYALYLEADYD